VTEDTYPHHWAGDEADPPAPAAPRIVEMARRAQARLLATPDPLAAQRTAAPAGRLAHALEILGAEADTANPRRDRSSDGTWGDARHQAEGNASDHNGWLKVGGVPICRARDIDTDGLDLHAAFERARQLAAAGKLPQVTDGGYLILSGRITAPDFSRWRVYSGPNPHIIEGHVSVSRVPAQFDLRTPWGLFLPGPSPKPAKPPAPRKWTGPDLRGAGPMLRGEAGANGPRVQRLQAALAARFPAYRHGAGNLAADGWWGDVTGRWLDEFGRRSGVPQADGRNIGPRLALALYRAGIRP
jgi:hypothetical protein